MNKKRNYKYKGAAISISIIFIWLINLIWLLSLNVSDLHLGMIIVCIFVQTFLFTGLFITAHDAMHGSVLPNSKTWNNLFGNVAVKLYALFSFKKMKVNHSLHHEYVASQSDPDFHDAEHKNFIMWYLRFLRNYISWQQIVGMAIIYNLLKYIFNISDVNLVLFWVAPAILSTIQLFYFGTFLPHREPSHGYDNIYKSKSLYLPPFLSFLTCYHFGYHLEHHKYPYLPWWQLPKAKYID